MSGLGTVWKKILPASVYDSIRAVLSYRPNDPLNLWQQVPQMHKQTNIDRIKGYRYPAPGSREGASVPIRESEDDIYDTKQYTRDPRNVPQEEQLFVNTSKKTVLLEPSTIFKVGSPGSNIPAVKQYDPSGLRASMTASWKEMDLAIAKNATPNHFPRPEWETPEGVAALIKEAEEKGIPITMGRRHVMKASSNYNEERW